MSYAADRRNFLKFLAASPLFANSALAEGLRWPDPMEWAPHDPGKLIADPTQALDVFDFEPVMKAECAARAFRLHGDRRRRRNDAAGQPRGLPEIRAAAAAAGRCQQDRHERRDFRREVRQSDRDRADRQQPGLSPRRGDRRRQGRQGRQPSADPFDGRHHLDRGRDRRARRAGLVPALHHAKMGGRRSAGQAGRDRGRAGDRRHARCAVVGEVGDLCPACAAPTRANAAAATALSRLSVAASRIFPVSNSAASAAPPSPT